MLKWSCFCYVGSSCEGVDSNRWLPLQCKLWMSINDVCFGEGGILWCSRKNGLYVHMELFNLSFGTSLIFDGFFAYGWVEIWVGLHIPKCKVASFLWFAHFGMRICGGAQLLSCSHWVDHTSILLIFHVKLIGERSFWGIKYDIFLCIPSFKYCNLKNQRVIHDHLFLRNSSSSMFQDPTNKSHFNLKTCPWKFHSRHWVKRTQNILLIGLGS